MAEALSLADIKQSGSENNAVSIDLETLPSTGGASRSNPKLLNRIIKLLKKGNRYSEKRDFLNALKYHFEAWQLDYENTDSIKCLAHTLGQLGERAKAIRLFEIMLELNPEDPETAGLVGQLAIDLEMWEQALELNRLFMRMSPHNIVGYNNFATALREMERFEEAIAFLKDIIPMFPEAAALWNVLATAVSFRDGIEAAMPFYEEALRLDPKLWHALNNIGRAYNNLGDYEKVVDYCRRANKVRNDQPQSHIGLALGCLGLGQLEEGWKEYEWRQNQNRNAAIRWTHELARWNGQELAGKSILICPEQGVGDEILFASNFADALAEADKVYIGADRRLIDLFKRSFPKASEIGGFRDLTHNAYRYRDMEWVRNLKEPIDYFIESGSLNRFYRNKIEDFPSPGGGYLVPDPSRVAFWKDRLDQIKGGPKIGICWRSGLRSAERNVWYADLSDWAPIFKIKGCNFINLQYGDCAEELDSVKKEFGVTVHDWDDIDLKDDLDDAAALTQACDLIVSIGAAPGMMAMAVGKPILWMFPFAPWWTFGQAPKTPLHNRSHIFAADKVGNWASVTEPTAEALKAYIGDPKSLDSLFAGGSGS